MSEDVDGYEDKGARLLVCVFGGRVLGGLGRKAGRYLLQLSGLSAGRGGGAEAGLQEVRDLLCGALAVSSFQVV